MDNTTGTSAAKTTGDSATAVSDDSPNLGATACSVSVVIPAFNEESAIEKVVADVKDVLAGANIEHEVLVVNDASTDATARVAEAAGAVLVEHQQNLGYGAAVKTGARRSRFPYILIIDADGTYPVETIPELLSECPNADMVVGSRTRGAVSIPWVRRPAKWFLRVLAGYLLGRSIPDLNSGMRAFRRGLLLEYIDILPNRFSLTSTLTLASMGDGYAVRFLPIEYHKRIGRSKIKPIDALGFLILILRTMIYFRPLRVFLPVAAGLFVGAAVKGAIDTIVYDNLEDTTVVLFLAGLQTLFFGMLADLMCFVRRRIGTRSENGIDESRGGG